MNVLLIAFAGLLIWYLGIGLGTLMRLERKVASPALVKIFFLSPLFTFEGFIIWTYYFIHDLLKSKRVKISFFLFMYKSYFKIMPYMCEAFSVVVIKQEREKRKAGNVVRGETKRIFQRGYDMILTEEGI